METVVEDRKMREELFSALSRAMVSTSNLDEVREFLDVVLTPTEKDHFGKRVEILKKLRQGVPYGEIKKSLRSTDNTIAKMSNLLKGASPRFLKFLDELVRQDLFQKGGGLRFTPHHSSPCFAERSRGKLRA